MCPPSSIDTAVDTSIEVDNTKWIPKTPISQAAYEHASSVLAPPILAHSIRVYLYANALARREKSEFAESTAKQDLLFVGCLFHDIGTSSNYNSSARFEVDGADAASTFLEKFNVDKSDRHDVWTAIACHTSPGIAERIGELPRLVRLGVSIDFGKATGDLKEFADNLKEPFEEKFPRAGIEECLVNAVVGQAKEKPEKAPMVSWVGVLYLKAIGQLKWDVDAF